MTVDMVSWMRSTVSQRCSHFTKYGVSTFQINVQEADQLLFTALLIDSSKDKLLLRYSIPDLPLLYSRVSKSPSVTFSHAPQVMNASNEEWDGVPAKTFQREV